MKHHLTGGARCARWIWFAVCLMLCGSPLLAAPRLTTAAGSPTLVAPARGDRPYLEYRSKDNKNALSAGVPRRTIIKVYAKENETIDLGSSANGIGQGRINYRDPTYRGPEDGISGSCPTNVGIIASRAEEQAGPAPNPGGYTPCTIVVGPGQEGVWEIDFVSPNPVNEADPKALPAVDPGAWPQPNGVSYVVAWDVAVRDTKPGAANPGAIIPGRVYADYLALNMGAYGRSLNAEVFIQTYEGFRYRVNLNGVDPFGFIFFSNNKGFKDQPSADGKAIYQSVELLGKNPNYELPPGVFFHSPAGVDTETDFTHKIFFEEPASDLPPTANSPRGPVRLLVPPSEVLRPDNFVFVGAEGAVGKTRPGQGGTFRFTNPGLSRNYVLIIDIDHDGQFRESGSTDAVVRGSASTGLNEIPWDGRDGTGAIVPAGTVRYNVSIQFTAGEVHFPFIDAENNVGGFIIERLIPPRDSFNSPDPVFDADRVYYDDSKLTNLTNGPTNPISVLPNGINSSTGAHKYGITSGPLARGFGDGKGIDTWAFVPALPFVFEGVIEIVDQSTAITLESFTASRTSQGVNVRWTTSAEHNTWGFHLLRSADGTRAGAVRVTPEPILSKGRGAGGASYAWLDTGAQPGVAYSYWLQEIEVNWSTREYGPVTVSSSSTDARFRIAVPLVVR